MQSQGMASGVEGYKIKHMKQIWSKWGLPNWIFSGQLLFVLEEKKCRRRGMPYVTYTDEESVLLCLDRFIDS